MRWFVLLLVVVFTVSLQNAYAAPDKPETIQKGLTETCSGDKLSQEKISSIINSALDKGMPVKSILAMAREACTVDGLVLAIAELAAQVPVDELQQIAKNLGIDANTIDKGLGTQAYTPAPANPTPANPVVANTPTGPTGGGDNGNSRPFASPSAP